MDNHVILRNEEERDWPAVERLTRRAFYNQYVPGCVEHYLAKRLRSHPDFIPELDFVAELNGQVIGNIMFTRAKLTDEQGSEKDILTFGPLCIAPEHQRRGYGKVLMEHAFQRAVDLGHTVIVILGSPVNYVSSGFKSCKKYNICLDNGKFPAAMMVKELKEGALDGRKWFYRYSPIMDIDEQTALEYDSGLEPMEKKYLPSQDEFYIMSHSFVEDGDM